jgi:NAD(P)H-binding
VPFTDSVTRGDTIRVAVLGAYGAVGRRLVRQTSQPGYRVTAVGRDSARLHAISADAHEVASVRDLDAMRRLAAGNDVIVNATGSESADLAEHVTNAGAAFVDIGAEPSYLEVLAEMRPARPVLAGTGLAPGLTNILADAVPGAGPLQIGIVAGMGEEHGAAARDWIWRTAGEPIAGAAVYRTRHRFDVPGLGPRTLVRAAFGEQVQLARTSGREVTSWLGLDPPFATAFLRLAGAVPASGRYLDRLSAPLARVAPQRDRWIVVVAAGGETLSWASGRSQSVATALVAGLSLRPVLAAPPGVWAAHQLLTIADIEEELRAADIVVTRSGGPCPAHT